MVRRLEEEQKEQISDNFTGAIGSCLWEEICFSVDLSGFLVCQILEDLEKRIMRNTKTPIIV